METELSDNLQSNQTRPNQTGQGQGAGAVRQAQGAKPHHASLSAGTEGLSHRQDRGHTVEATV